ncbi:MAG: hypothetical protein WC222_00670 [Parachlamydiales bacterium]
MDKFWKELQTGDIQFRDRWQFELKSEFAATSANPKSNHRQEFYIFVPNSLLINSQTYTVNDFFKDQNNFIRFKTPRITLKELLDESNENSPLTRFKKGLVEEKKFTYELKLLANIVRSELRDEVHQLVDFLKDRKKPLDLELFAKNVTQLCVEWKVFRQKFKETIISLDTTNGSNIAVTSAYVDEFLSGTFDFYFVGLLKYLRKLNDASLSACDALICELLSDELKIRVKYFPLYANPQDPSARDEEIPYRQSLLNKFVMDVLHLVSNRDALMNKHRNLIGSIAAGIAMLVFLLLFVSQASQFVVSSEPYIFLTVVFYILKDRIKEGLRSIPSIRGFGWLANYKTEIRSPDNSRLMGTLMELFTFLDQKDADPKIMEIRNKHFHTMLEKFQRPEKIIYYKKSVCMFTSLFAKYSRLNIISRFNISQFFWKAGDPYFVYNVFDPETKKIVEIELPKTYHINIILKNTYAENDTTTKVTYQKFRLIVDKNGIKEVLQVNTN